MNGEWVEIGEYVAWRWDLAEIKRMDRTKEEANAILRQLARQRVRFILNRIRACKSATVLTTQARDSLEVG